MPVLLVGDFCGAVVVDDVFVAEELVVEADDFVFGLVEFAFVYGFASSDAFLPADRVERVVAVALGIFTVPGVFRNDGMEAEMDTSFIKEGNMSYDFLILSPLSTILIWPSTSFFVLNVRAGLYP